MKKSIIIYFVVMVVLIAGVIGWRWEHRTASLTVVFNLPSTSGLQVTLNNAPFTVKKLNAGYSLKPGSYDLRATQSDYKDFSTHFVLSTKQPLLINVAMTPKASGSLTNVQQVPALGNSLGVQLLNTQYFYSNTWAFATLQDSSGNSAALVAKYDGALSKWEIAAGPGTFFTKSDIALLPADVQTYLQEQGYVSSGGSN